MIVLSLTQCLSVCASGEQQQEQLTKLRKHLDEEVSHHEHEIARHQEAINRHKGRIDKLKEQQKKHE